MVCRVQHLENMVGVSSSEVQRLQSNVGSVTDLQKRVDDEGDHVALVLDSIQTAQNEFR